MIALEVIASSAHDCQVAEANGAQRIELCMALELGGLTPSLGLMAKARRSTTLPIFAMLRPRAGDFIYDEGECATIIADVHHLLDAGADGLVFGSLTPSGEVHRAPSLAVLEAAMGHPVTFHRAFDLVRDPLTALDALIEMGFARVLTSGLATTSLLGADQIDRLRRRAGGRIQIVAGGGISEANVAEVIARTGCEEVHASLSMRSEPTQTPGAVRLESGAGIDGSFRMLDGDRVRRVREILDDLS